MNEYINKLKYFDLAAKQKELLALNEELMIKEEELRKSLAELQKNQEALKKNEERYRLVVSGASDGLWDWDITMDTAFISERWKNIIGFESQQINGYYKDWLRRIHPDDVKKLVQNLNTHIEKKTSHYSCEYRIKLKNGKFNWISSRGMALWDSSGKAIRMAGSHTDITEKKKTENKLKHLAYYDSLTDIPLRIMFMNRLKLSMADAEKNDSKLAVMFLDIDNFKAINDTFGHHIGDKLLKKIVGKLKSCIRSSDTLSRLGGDEFALLISDLGNADKVAQRIIELFNKPLNISCHSLYITISIGIAVYPDNGKDGKSLLKKADMAMYKAKENGKSNLQYFNNHILIEKNLQGSIKKDLRTAMENDEFFLCYQPLIDIKTKKTVCVEALIRWKHPRRGILNPMEFIPVAEETRLIIPIGQWVLKNACRQLVQWHEMGYTNCCLSINVSAIQLQQPDFAAVVNKILVDTGLSPKYLEIEITESVFIESFHTVTMNLNYLKQQGIKIAIDDFGTGYCCMGYIKDFAINSLKIDKSFIFNIGTSESKAKAIVDAIIALGHKLNIEITAEGVEGKKQYDYLKNKGCDKIQGYYFSKPLLPREAVEAIKTWE